MLDQEGEELSPAEKANMGIEMDRLYADLVRRNTSLVVDAKRDSESSRFPPSLKEQGGSCLAAVPLCTLHNQLGMLTAVRRTGESFSPAEVNILETTVRHLAIAIENFRLSESLQQTNEDLQELVEDRT
ncbi:MAG: GAF domain-containing protein, partial [Planctomycetota bacterium]